ncbi:MAG: type II secretion system minor pseudopilin GspH [Thioploca sp.]|nr:type II secretion system minor pseudopilin GspH [Thioploca sp.]
MVKPVNNLNTFSFSTSTLIYPLKGFTLIEIMVVLIIIGVVLSFVTLSVGNGRQTQQLQQEAQRLASLLTLASQEAILQAKELGVAFTPEGYRFYEWQGQTKWQALNNDDLFYPRILPPTIRLVFILPVNHYNWKKKQINLNYYYSPVVNLLLLRSD